MIDPKVSPSATRRVNTRRDETARPFVRANIRLSPLPRSEAARARYSYRVKCHQVNGRRKQHAVGHADELLGTAAHRAANASRVEAVGQGRESGLKGGAGIG